MLLGASHRRKWCKCSIIILLVKRYEFGLVAKSALKNTFKFTLKLSLTTSKYILAYKNLRGELSRVALYDTIVNLRG